MVFFLKRMRKLKPRVDGICQPGDLLAQFISSVYVRSWADILQNYFGKFFMLSANLKKYFKGKQEFYKRQQT